MADKPKVRKVLCPECETEVTITRDDEGDDVGSCENCNLNVGRLLTRRRYEKANEVMNEREKSEKKNTTKKKDSGFFGGW